MPLYRDYPDGSPSYTVGVTYSNVNSPSLTFNKTWDIQGVTIADVWPESDGLICANAAQIEAALHGFALGQDSEEPPLVRICLQAVAQSADDGGFFADEDGCCCPCVALTFSNIREATGYGYLYGEDTHVVGAVYSWGVNAPACRAGWTGGLIPKRSDEDPDPYLSGAGVAVAVVEEGALPENTLDGLGLWGEQTIIAGGGAGTLYERGADGKGAILAWTSPRGLGFQGVDSVVKYAIEMAPEGGGPGFLTALSIRIDGAGTPGIISSYSYEKLDDETGRITFYWVATPVAALWLRFTTGILAGLGYDGEYDIGRLSGAGLNHWSVIIGPPEGEDEVPGEVGQDPPETGDMEIVPIPAGTSTLPGLVVTRELNGFRIGFGGPYADQPISAIELVENSLQVREWEEGVGIGVADVAFFNGATGDPLHSSSIYGLGPPVGFQGRGAALDKCGPFQGYTLNFSPLLPEGLSTSGDAAAGSISVS